MAGFTLEDFVAESNRIEGIRRKPTPEEVDATHEFCSLRVVTIPDLEKLTAVFAPGKPLRKEEGMNVRVGNYYPPPGGPEIVKLLHDLLNIANDPYLLRGKSRFTEYKIHADYESIHPFMDGNGRSGRALWLWTMKYRTFGIEAAPLGFLHTWYYQSLSNYRP